MDDGRYLKAIEEVVMKNLAGLDDLTCTGCVHEKDCVLDSGDEGGQQYLWCVHAIRAAVSCKKFFERPKSWNTPEFNLEVAIDAQKEEIARLEGELLAEKVNSRRIKEKHTLNKKVDKQRLARIGSLAGLGEAGPTEIIQHMLCMYEKAEQIKFQEWNNRHGHRERGSHKELEKKERNETR